MRERPRRGTFDFCAIRFELAAVARARNHLGVRLPLRDATKMRAHGGDGIKTFRHAHDVNLLVLEKGHGVDGIQIGIARPKRRRGFEQNVGRKILIGDGDRAETGNPEGSSVISFKKSRRLIPFPAWTESCCGTAGKECIAARSCVQNHLLNLD